MKTPCESASKYLLPSIRAIIAKKLVEDYKFTQQNAAAKLGMTQSAMSRYLCEKRGAIMNITDEIDQLTDDVAQSIYAGKMTPEQFVQQLCNICMKYRKDENLCKKR